MERGSKEWYEHIDKISNGKWMTTSYQNLMVEQDFPAPWDKLSDSDKQIWRNNYSESLKRREKEKSSRLKMLNIPPAFYKAESQYAGQIDSDFIAVFGGDCTGKTTLLCSYLLDKKNGIYIKASEYQRHMDQNDITSDDYTWEERLQKRKILVMDDVGEEVVRNGYPNYVLEHLEWRMDYNMPFIFATRLGLDKLSVYSNKLLVRIKKKFIQPIFLVDE